MKDAYYFPHDSNARGDPKTKFLISVYGMKGYGMYWVLIEVLRDQDEFKLPVNNITLSSLADDFRISFDEAKKFIDDCIYEFTLLKTDSKFMWSDSLIARMQKMIKSREKRSAAGKKGMESRWGNKPGGDNDVITTLCEDANTVITKDNKGKESKGKESKVSIILKEEEEEEGGEEKKKKAEGELFKFFNQNIGPITPFQSDTISGYLDDGLEPEMILTVLQDGQGKDDIWAWIKTVLNNSLLQNIKTFEQYEAKKVEKANKKKKVAGGGGSAENKRRNSGDDGESIDGIGIEV